MINLRDLLEYLSKAEIFIKVEAQSANCTYLSIKLSLIYLIYRHFYISNNYLLFHKEP